MQEKFTNSLRLVVLHIAESVFVNVRVVQVNLIILNSRKGVANLTFAGAESLDLSSMKDQARFISFKDVVIPAGF